MDSELIADIISKVFPARSPLVWEADEVPPEDRFWIIPGKEGPRWIVPQNPRYGWPVLRQWRPYDLTSRVKWAALMAAYRTGQLGMVPGVVAVGVSGASDRNWGYLSWISERRPVPLIYVGTPGPTRKTVAHLVDKATCRTVGVVKIPLGVRAAENILHEAEMLQRLDKEKPGMAPRLQYVDRVTGISVQDSITGRLTSRRLTQAHLNWLRRLQAPGTETSLKKQSESLMEQLTHIERLEEATRRLLENLLDQLDDPTPLPAAWVHGDFAPWNLKWVEEEKLVAVDWEEARPSGLPTTDLIYFHVIQDFLFCDELPDKAWQPLQGIVNSHLVRAYLGSLRVTDSLANSLVLFALVELLIRRMAMLNGTFDPFSKYLKKLIQRTCICMSEQRWTHLV
ncbi:MAG: aminoglycoside phosphotransferase family protein [Deltaproteobacteria bacterium]|nr:aminoglycoside phosphotransferase family protein [Deltaproteobacteria bacterium]MBW2074706.1 aminoglycoside phosphotransferase family protein [Deltaproteobacteria bacterium]